MPKIIQQFHDEAQAYIVLFNLFAQKHSLVGASADHICYKCASSESFEMMRTMFEGESLFLYQAMISGRRIAYIKLKKGIKTALGVISFVELSDQKPDGSQKEGFDHIEVYPVTLSYEEMVQELKKTEDVFHVARPHHTTDDIDIGSGFLFRCTQVPLLEKIKAAEML